MHTVYLGLGSNLDNRKENLEKAIKELNFNSNIKVLKVSGFFENPALGPGNQSDYINCVIKIKTNLTPMNLLKIVKNLEKKLGRKKAPRWYPRIIDIDILFYDNCVFKDKKLIIPHPEVHKRHFVLKPLMEIEPDLVHPVFKKKIIEFFYN